MKSQKSGTIFAFNLAQRGVYVDSFSKNKAGNYIVRKGFFYTNGKTSQQLADRIATALPEVEILNHGQVWKAFSGGATVSRQSHWWVEFRVRPEQPKA